MIDEETHKAAGRKGQHGLDRAGPDRGPHGQQVIVQKAVAITFAFQEFAERKVGIAFFLEQARGGAEEARNVGQHSVIARLQEIGRLRHKSLEGAFIFERTITHGNAERHVAELRRHIEGGEQADQVRIGRLVIDDEAGIDRNLLAVIINGNRVAVAAEPVICLIYGNLMARGQQPRRAKPGDTASDNGYSHSNIPPEQILSAMVPAVQLIDV